MPESNTPINNLPNNSSDDNQPLAVDINVMHEAAVDDALLSRVTREILRDHNISRGAISIAIVDDPTIRRLNVQYLQHDYETDVLSFVLECDADSGLLEGEIIASLDTATNVAAELNAKPSDELLLYIIHGMLHLVGYGDKNEADKLEMRAAERKYMTYAGADYREPSEPTDDDLEDWQ